ncbi:hypothetical protein E1A91_D03G069200v1 [Gossypium mustelinum]|uniref:VWFA domain-containing protein n=1 Tax=Gossypium mustelinum TaxID=34275 RepID=A0A5D2VJK8_GOSMU|nr:hypothetical protein E1A91_D03G069200v1 [Gossypium mustelinum]
MVLEATMICIDNSEWMRNDDYSLSRFQAQADAVSLICGAKTESNPKNTMGILTMENTNLYHDLCKACSSVRNPCLITSVKDEQLFIRSSSFHSISYVIIVTFVFSMYVSMHTGLEMRGEMNLVAGIQIAYLRFSFEMIGKCLMWVVGAELIIAGLYLVILGKSEESKYLSENEPIYSVSENNEMESTFIRPLLENKLQS